MNALVPEPEKQIIAPATPEHPRNGEADIIQLKNGDLLLAYGRWNKGGGDFDSAEIWAKTSHNSGKTWADDRVLVPNEGKLTTFSVSLLRTKPGEILMCYITKDDLEDCQIFFRRSLDEGRTWSSRTHFQMPQNYSGYAAITNARMIRLKNGRILAAGWDGWARDRVIVSFVLYSDDDGRTWKKSTDADIRDIDSANLNGAQEPAVVELKDGRIMMLIRCDLGCIARSYSSDHGETWSKPELIKELISPLAPSSIIRLPQTGDILLVWNYSRTRRTPLCTAISKDDGKTWEHIRTLEEGRGFAYTSIISVKDKVLLTYWQYEPVGISLKMSSVDYRWFY